jgi:GNAT superfamily N-acetyltransferase
LRANSKLDVFVRPLQDADAGDIVVLYDRATATEPTIGPVPRETWERFVRWPQNRNGRDFRVALWDGRLVGLAESSHRDQSDRSVRYCKLVVDPEFRRQGIGAALLTELLDIDRGTPKYRSRRPPRTNGRRAWLSWKNSDLRISNPKSACAVRDLAFGPVRSRSLYR